MVWLYKCKNNNKYMMSAIQKVRTEISNLGRRILLQRRHLISSKYPCSTNTTTTTTTTDSINNDSVCVEQEENITLIGINRPEKRNCINRSTAEALLKAFQDFDANDASRVAVLYGVGGNFCSGYDLKELAGEEDEEAQVTLSNIAPDTRGPMGPTRYQTKKPVIAAVEGYAVGGGLELALWCDLRIVEETAVMGVYCRRFGVPLIDGGTVRLPAIVGLGRALDLILTGRGIRAKEALEWGLASRIVACGTGIGQAVKLAQEIAKFPQECMLADRSSVYNATFCAKSLQEALQYEHKNANPVIFEESQDGARKFMNGIGRHGKFNLNTPSKIDSAKSKLS